MISTFFISLAVLTAPAAPAEKAVEPLAVRAGEHGAYSRIVIPNAPEKWEISSEKRMVSVLFSDAAARLDLSDLHTGRKAHRILKAASATSDEGVALVLTLNCNCVARAERSEKNSLIVDIFDAPPATPTATPATPTRKQAARPTAPATPEPTPEDLRAARDRMIALLAAANDQGVVALKHQNKGPVNLIPEHVNENSGATSIRNASFDEAKDGGDTKHACVNAASFWGVDPDANEPTYEDIVALRQQLEDADSASLSKIETTLGYAYLRLGFFEEAAALTSTAASEAGSEMILIGGLAAFGRGDMGAARQALAHFRFCGSVYGLIWRAASNREPADAPYTDNDYDALNMLPAALRGAFAEALGLQALEAGDLSASGRFRDIASAAYGTEETPGLVILRAALPDDLLQDDPVKEKLAVVAQTPGPYQSRALGVLAEEFDHKAIVAYDGFLDDLAEQTPENTATRSEITSAISGVKALAKSGRIGAALENLRAVQVNSPKTKETTGYIARSIIANALAGDVPAHRLAAIDQYFHHKDLFGSDKDDQEMRLAIARELATLGAPQLTANALSDIPVTMSAEADALAALAHLTVGDNARALALFEKHPGHSGLAETALRASENLNDKSQIQKTASQLLRDKKMDAQKTKILWRAGEWRLAADSFAGLPAEQLDADAATEYALAVLKTGGEAAPAAAKQVLGASDSNEQALAHMFAPAPAFEPQNLRKIDMFITGVSKETDFFRRGLRNE